MLRVVNLSALPAPAENVAFVPIEVWKPYVILETLKDPSIPWNDIVPWKTHCAHICHVMWLRGYAYGFLFVFFASM